MKKSFNLSTKQFTNEVKDHLRSAYNVQAEPKLTVDWNLNRYSTPTATNTPDEDTHGFDIERFPIESIVEPLRPGKGAAKALVNQATASAGYARPQSARFYVSDTEDKYKYWTSPDTTNGSGVFPLHTDSITTARPRVSYDKVLKANKIVIRLENTWATPSVHEVRIASTVGGEIGGVIGGANPSIDLATGTLTLYYNGIGWVSTKPDTLVTTNVAAIEYRVEELGAGYKRNGEKTHYVNRGDIETFIPTSGANSSLNVIAIEAHYEVDMSDRLIGTSDTFDIAEASELYPLGTITSNTATVNLSNHDQLLNRENADSPYAGLLEPNAEFKLEYIFTIGETQHSVAQFKMYSGEWNSSEFVTTVELNDYSKYLKEIKPNPTLIENKTSTEIVWRILDSVGFTDYSINQEDLVDEAIIPVFWITGEETVWEVLDELSKATQTAIYFDGDGILQVKTREAAFRSTATPDWTLRGEDSGGELADIIGWSPSGETSVNKVDVRYRTTKWKTNSLGKPAMSKVWEPETDSLVVRSTPIMASLSSTGDVLHIGKDVVRFWPYESKVQVDGEIIQYKGKKFVYFTYTETVAANGTITFSGETRNVVTVNSEEEYKKYNRKTPHRYRHKNHYTGGLAITERGVWNTEPRLHEGEINNWTTKLEIKGKGTPEVTNNPRGFNLNRKDSTVTLNTPKKMKDGNDTYWAFRGGSASTSYKSYGTKFKFNRDEASTTQVAGLCYQLSGARENGYYVQIRLTNKLTGAQRKSVSEVCVYSKVGGVTKLVSKGPAIAIAKGVWYELDVYHSGSGNNQKITVFVNGQLVTTATTTADTAQSESGRFGFFAKGKTNITFEYIYAIARQTSKEPTDDFGFYDLKYGGVRGEAWQREHVWETRTRRIKIRKRKWTKEKYRHNEYVFDEFGPYVHEVREFDVKFDPTPVRFSYLFNTNEWYSVIPEYSANPFGAKFVVANTSRDNAILHGEDSLVYAGSSSPVNQVCVVLGQDLEIADEETVTRKNLSAIRARGEVVAELSSDWIQSKSMARDLAEWMTEHWSEAIDTVEASIFGNPLLETGDVVDVEYALEDMTISTHKYYVTGVRSEFNNGISTTLTLRRVRPATNVS